VDDLLPYEKNPRKISEKQLEDLKRSIKKFNLAEVPAIDTDNAIVAGHQRIKVLQLLGRGAEEIDVRVPNRKLAQEEYEQYLLTSNAVSGDWNYEILKGFDLNLLLEVGFDDQDLANIWDDSLETENDNFDVEKEIAKIKTPRVKLGDLYQLGDHRLICGDSTQLETVTRLVGENQINVTLSDPVYNINYDYDSGLGKSQKYGGSANDKKTDAEYREFLKATMENSLAVSEKDCHVFYFCDQKYIGLVQDIYAELGLDSKRVCIWVKNNANMTPQIAFNKAYEPCVYATRGKPYISARVTNLNEILNKETGTGNRLPEDILDLFDIWLAKRLPTAEYLHPTQKPVSLNEKPLRRCTKPGDAVLDLFGGSGSVLIACEQMKRRCFMAELDPVFCEVIIRRYESLSGKSAQLIGNEKSND